jgi:hypothetical protein
VAVIVSGIVCDPPPVVPPIRETSQQDVKRVEKLTPAVLAKAFRGQLVWQHQENDACGRVVEADTRGARLKRSIRFGRAGSWSSGGVWWTSASCREGM